MLIICVKHRLRFRLILRNLVWKHNYRKQWSEKWWPETQFFSLFIYGQGTVCSSVYVFFFSFFVCFISVISIFLGQLPRNASLLFTHTLKSSWKQPQHIPIVGFFFLKKQSLWSFSFIRYKTLQAVLQLRQSSLCTYQRPSPGVDSVDIRWNSAGFADFCRQFLARDGAIGLLMHCRGKIHGERPARFGTSPPSWKWKIRTALTGYIAL